MKELVQEVSAQAEQGIATNTLKSTNEQALAAARAARYQVGASNNFGRY